MKNYKDEFVKWYNKTTNNEYQTINQIYYCERTNTIEEMITKFCSEKDYDFFEVLLKLL